MLLNSSKSLFFFTLILGIMFCLSSNNWIMIWSGLEISLMSFLPMINYKGTLNSESSVKYFIIQSISSSMFVLSIIMLLMNYKHFSMILLISLLIKIGVAPFHNWVLNVIEGLDYNLIFIMLILLKISPFFIMSFIESSYKLNIVISLMVGSIFGINQSSTRKILAYSSIFNLSFMLSVIETNLIWMTYLFIYSFILSILLFFLKQLNICYINQIILNEFSTWLKMSLLICFLSLGGMPPMLGFLNKLMILEMMLMKNEVLLLTLMIMSSLLIIFLYIRMIYSSIMMFSSLMKWEKFFSGKFPSYFNVLFFLNFPIMFYMKMMN
nr:NADH dehydrogenase subunit 2 [Nionia sp.]